MPRCEVISSLTSEEKKIAREIKSMLKNGEKLPLIERIKKMDIRLVTKLARERYNIVVPRTTFRWSLFSKKRIELQDITNLPPDRRIFGDFATFCKIPELKTHWEELIPQQKLPGFDHFTWQVQPNIHPFDQVRFAVLYAVGTEEGLQEYCNHDTVTTCREEAAELGCFNAQCAEIAIALRQFHLTPENAELRNKILVMAYNMRVLHDTAGAIILTITYTSIALAYKNFHLGLKPEKNDSYNEHMRMAGIFLQEVDTLTKCGTSAAAENARLGGALYPWIASFFSQNERFNCLKTLRTTLQNYTPASPAGMTANT